MKKLYNKLVQMDLQTLRTSIICTVVYFSLLAKGLTKSGFWYRVRTDLSSKRLLCWLVSSF